MLIIAHRGASGYAPENTLSSMELAISQGCDVIELDVHLTKDEQLIVCHDFTVDRTSNGTGEIKNLTLAEIKELDAGSWFSEQFIGERMPTLEEVLNFIPDTLFLNVEIKKNPTDNRELEKKLVDILVKYQRTGNTLVSSFNHLSIRKLKKLNDEIKIGVAIEADLIEPVKYLEQNDLSVYSYHPCYDYVYPEIVQQFHNHNIKVNCWTVNDKELAKQLEKMGVDSIITNFPDILG